MRLEGKVSVITGGASGFGAAGARCFAQEGSKVVIADLNAELGEAVAEELRGEGGSALFVQADVTQEADCTRLVEEAVAAFGGLDVVWANAGIAHGSYSVEELDLGIFDRMMHVNVLGPFLTVRAALPALRASSAGAIVITASLSGIKGRPDLAFYQASKGAAVMLTRSLAAELARDGIRVNAVNPLASNTPMMPVFLENRDAGSNDDFLAAVASAVPLGRLVEPEDVAAAALFLASDEAKMITGVNLPIDGGASA